MTQTVKPLLINTGIRVGGSAKAVVRLFRGLRKRGIEAHLICHEPSNGEEGILGVSGAGRRLMAVMSKAVERSLLRFYPGRSRVLFTSAWFGTPVMSRVRELRANVIHLNQFYGGFLGVGFLRHLAQPVVWTLHDWWSITGGCHFPGVCGRHRVGCGQCPCLGSRSRLDLSRVNFRAKARSWRQLNARLISVSTGLKAGLQESPIFKGKSIEVVPNGLDLEVFRPLPKRMARTALAVPEEAKVLLFGAMGFRADRNKGFEDVQRLSTQLAGEKEAGRYLIVTFGDNAWGREEELGVKSKALGRVADDLTLALIYSAADVTLVPSRQESFGLTAAESLACGTPVLAYQTGGLTDIVDHESNGFLAAPFSFQDFRRGALWLLDEAGSKEGQQRLAACARNKAVREFDIMEVARRYIRQYELALAG